ncbi:MAG: Oligopeptide-binding protein AppA [Chlamydiae bacterium]|nr:Oligopeptide-binding protein AppA [Chlamydiota bacterium]
MKALFRWGFGFATLTLLALGYWSMVLQEEDLKTLRSEIDGMKREMQMVRFKQVTESSSSKEVRFLSDYPNLLAKDPFYSQTLPTLLGSNFLPRGIRREALLGRPENLHPFSGFAETRKMIDMCNVTVAQNLFGIYETLSPNMAIKMEARPLADDPDVEEFWVHLRDDVYWQPLNPRHFPDDLTLSPHFLQKHQVTAHDFKFYFDAIMNPYMAEAKAAAVRNYIQEIEEFRVVDDLTFVVRWKKDFPSGQSESKVKYTAKGLTGSLQPLPCFVYQYFSDGKKIVEEDSDSEAYRNNSVWAQNFSHHFTKNIIVSCGPWLFNGMNDEGISFKRNPDYYNPYAVLVEGINYTFKESFDAIWQDFKAEKIDMCRLAPNQLPELEDFLNSEKYQKQPPIKEVDFVDSAYYYIGWNQAKPYFNSKNIRQAMTLAIDRNRIIQQNLNEMGVVITGPFFCYSPSYDPSIASWSFNPQEAKTLLDEEGWIDMDGDGIRDKVIDGKRIPFRFSLIYFAKNISSKVICEYIATTLREIGIDCQLCGLDLTDLAHTFEDKSFDAICMGWSLGSPPDDPRQLWHSSGAKEKGSSNAVGFVNLEADSIIDSLQYEYNAENRSSLYHKFHKIIHEEAPYTFLYSPKTRLLYRDYVKNLFIPRDREDLIPEADISQPDDRVVWLER